LRLLRQGEITEDEYLERRLDVETAHLKGKLSKARLAIVRSVVRAHLDEDPLLLRLRTRLRLGGAKSR
jgi:hypothetical protein